MTKLFRLLTGLGIASVLAAGLSCTGTWAAQDPHDRPAGHRSEAQARVGEIAVSSPWARATAPTARTGGAYMALSNSGSASDRLLAVSTPVAGRAELHTHLSTDGIMRMRPVDAVEIPAGGSVELAPGGYHVMLMDLKQPLVQGTSFPMSLSFERAGTIQVNVQVGSAGASTSPSHGAH
jgi:periplasmic copper chaperone A